MRTAGWDSSRPRGAGSFATPSRLAGRAGVRIHTFSLGRDVVRRGVNPVLARMASRSGGRFTQLEAPGEIVELLRSTSFSFVSSVRLANATRGDEIADIRTARSREKRGLTISVAE